MRVSNTTGNPSSGASIGIPEKSLQLTRKRALRYFFWHVQSDM
jgi:hypothetical protein